ncbi:hypothetical protein MM300_02640 [Evansella sp. LMS18]|jgi:type II secretory pathway pseudopilin PulG|uniref:type IV pilus modification PilV family protein n=1 Tax=Evansella sp. LMS18 TaxID=2924033 RepID=UPI0020D0DC64|nr:hypothetical protein [Evansella sp. LMS18]UTR11248.1 hypothetical protein MM300_02640 [Evansella sp. LMS18]
MKKMLVLFTQEESGRTLIEIIASIVLLSIIAIPFAGMFVQSSKSINVSDEIINATYVAQTEMEKIYQLSSENNNFHDLISKLDYDERFENDFYKETEKYLIKSNLTRKNNELVQVLVKVFEDEAALDAERPAAQMESIYLWEGN